MIPSYSSSNGKSYSIETNQNRSKKNHVKPFQIIVVIFGMIPLFVFLYFINHNVMHDSIHIDNKLKVKQNTKTSEEEITQITKEINDWIDITLQDAKIKHDSYKRILNKENVPIKPISKEKKKNDLSNSAYNQVETGSFINRKLLNEYDGKLHAVTYASHGGRDDRFCRAIESAIHNKIDIIVLGWGMKWKGLSQKLEAAYQYSKSIPKNDIILFTDAFDILYTQSSEAILSRFLELNVTLLFSAECGW